MILSHGCSNTTKQSPKTKDQETRPNTANRVGRFTKEPCRFTHTVVIYLMGYQSVNKLQRRANSKLSMIRPPAAQTHSTPAGTGLHHLARPISTGKPADSQPMIRVGTELLTLSHDRHHCPVLYSASAQIHPRLLCHKRTL